MLTIIITVILTWALLYEFFYSPKAQIKRLWKEIFSHAHEIGKIRKMMKDDGFGLYQIVHSIKDRERRAGNLINAILDYKYLNSEEDKDYIADNRYEHTDLKF